MDDLLEAAVRSAAFLPDRWPRRLGGVHAKLVRAREHIQTLTFEEQQFNELPPYTVTSTFDGDFEVLDAEVTLEPPTRLSIVLGDALYNMRSALDHLAWQFALATTAEPGRTAFPIYDTPEAFRRGINPQVHPEAARLMEAMQPYQPKAMLSDFGRNLVAVRDMGNRDKHRTLHIATALVEPKWAATFGKFETDDEGWARFVVADDRRHAQIRVHIGAQAAFRSRLVIEEDKVPTRSGLTGVGSHLLRATETAIAAFRPLFSVLAD